MNLLAEIADSFNWSFTSVNWSAYFDIPEFFSNDCTALSTASNSVDACLIASELPSDNASLYASTAFVSSLSHLTAVCSLPEGALYRSSSATSFAFCAWLYKSPYSSRTLFAFDNPADALSPKRFSTSDSPYCFLISEISVLKSFKASLAVLASALKWRSIVIPSASSSVVNTSSPYLSCKSLMDFLISSDSWVPLS